MSIPDSIRLVDLTVGQLRQIFREERAASAAHGGMASADVKLQIDTVPIEKLSELTGWSKSCIYKKCSLRQLPHFKVGKELRFDLAEINQWIENKKRKTGDQLVKDFEDRHKPLLKKTR